MVSKAPLRGLTVWQPYASLIAEGIKLVENREWSPPEFMTRGDGGYIAIHAGSTVHREAWEDAFAYAVEIGAQDKFPPFAELLAVDTTGRFGPGRLKDAFRRVVPYGAIVAVGRLEAIIAGANTGIIPWYNGPYGWQFDEIVKISPIECQGSKGLWELPMPLMQRVREEYGKARRSK